MKYMKKNFFSMVLLLAMAAASVLASSKTVLANSGPILIDSRIDLPGLFMDSYDLDWPSFLRGSF
jgi:hypothetical protein